MHKVDCHRHMGGSIPVDFVWEVIQQQRLHHLAESREEVRNQMCFQPGEDHGFHRFLDKFKILDSLRWTEKLIERSIELVCRDLLAEGVDYCWMRFSVNKYMEHMDWHRAQAIQFIRDCYDSFAPGRVGLMLSLKYESSTASQRQCAQLLDAPGVAESVMGIDLVGDEAYFDPKFYAPLLKPWRAAGKIVSGHVAESQSAVNFMQAVECMGILDVAHGFKIWEYPEFIQLALDREVCFHMAITSNYLTNTWRHRTWHPIRKLFDSGLMVTVGTDDPVQCNNTWDSEHELLVRLGFSQPEVEKIAQNAVIRSQHYGLI